MPEGVGKQWIEEPEKKKIQQEALVKSLARDIERVEELRYWISIKTYDSLRKKKAGKARAAADIDRQIAEMRKEFENRNQRLKEAGIDYLIINKKLLNDLRDKFMQLSADDRDKALEGDGEGSKIIDEMNDLLRTNFSKKADIAHLIISFNSISGEREKIKEVLEGEQEFAIAELSGNDPLLGEFINTTENLGFLCKRNKNGKILICRDEEKEGKEDEEKSRDAEFIPEIPGIPQQSLRLEQVQPQATMQAQQKVQAQIQPQTRPQNQQSKIPQIPLAGSAPATEEEENKWQEIEKKIMLNVSKMSGEEIEERQKRILINAKMQRWVLGTFKDDAEREEYRKAQMLLAALMKRKRELEGKK